MYRSHLRGCRHGRGTRRPALVDEGVVAILEDVDRRGYCEHEDREEENPGDAHEESDNARDEDDEGDEDDGDWEITDTGAEVDVFSNLGGTRHNLPAGTPLLLDPPVPGLVAHPSPLLTTALDGGTDPTGFATLHDMALYETAGDIETVTL